MWASVPTQFIMDGPNEIHKVTIARNVLKGYQPHEGNWPTQFLPAQREAAKKKFADLLSAEPELASRVDALERDQYTSIS